jgi:membrane-associated protease RseP (regulator of RpoE activity)
MLTGTLDGAEGQFELDTGSRGALTVMKPFAEANQLVQKTHATVSGTVGYGVGGPAKALLGRGGKFVLGPVTVESPVLELEVNASGGGNETHTAGNIGGDILKRFTVTLDYANRLVYFQPNAGNDTPEVFDRSGLWIARAKDGAIQIADVTTSSPAAKIGLVTGDEILSVNGKAAKDVQLYDLRTDFKGPVGTPFTLQIKTKSGEKTVTLVLADQV